MSQNFLNMAVRANAIQTDVFLGKGGCNAAPFTGVGTTIAMAVFDVLAMALFFGLSYWDANSIGGMDAKVWRAADAIFCASTLYLMVASGGYRETLLCNPLSQISRILVNSSGVALLGWGVLTVFDLSAAFPWPWHGPLTIVGGGTLAMCAMRLIAYRTLVMRAESGKISRTIAIVGGGQQGRQLIEALKPRMEPWTNVIGIFDDRIHRDEALELNVMGTVDDLIARARKERVDEILVALPWGAEDRLLSILEQLRAVPANVRLAPDVIGHHFLDRGFDRLDGVPVYNIYGKPISGWGALLKRIEDVVLASIALVLLFPVMIGCAIAIRMESRGPILFRQNRFGYNNQLIGVYKFRSMYHEMRDENASRLATQDDPRITKVGRILRRTSLDELPQLFNVLLGEMSMVGPRPHATQAKAAGKLYQEVVGEYAHRHKVKPGITGWAQVTGWRGETDTEEKILKRVEADLYYMERWSIFLDIEILFRTVLVVAGKNVY